MPPKKAKPASSEIVSTTSVTRAIDVPLPKPAAALISTSSIPRFLHFPLVVIISLSFSALANTFAAELVGAELASVSRNLNESWQVSSVLAWKVLELGISYFSDFDDIDVLAFTTLTHLPHLHLLHAFYQIPLPYILAQAALTLTSTTLPFFLLRPRSQTHTPLFTASYPTLIPGAAKPLTYDPYIRTYVALLASAVYTLAVYVSFQTWLPTHLIIHFDGLKSLAPAHHGMLLFFAATAAPIGLAAREFLFTPAVHPGAAGAAAEDDAKEDTSARAEFDPETATLLETLEWNLAWPSRLAPGTQVLALRALLLTLWTAGNTWFQAWVSIKGTEGLGALGWAGVWAGAAGACGLALGWVGDLI